LLLDPTNGLSDIEHGEIRALTIHGFTNMPVRLLRALRFAARMGFKLESRTQEWFNLAIERELQLTISPEDAGEELREVAKEDRPHLVLKEWESGDLLERIHPVLAKKHPGYDAINRLIKVRDDLFMAGYRPRLSSPMMLAILGRLKDREVGNVLSKLGFRSAEIDAIENFPDKAGAAEKELTGKKTNAPVDAYRFIEKLPVEVIAYILGESKKSTAVNKIKAFLHKWRPIRMGLPVVSTELETLGMPRGPKFDQVVEAVFAAQLNGRGKTPEERVKMLRKLSGIKEVPKKKEKEKKPTKEEKQAGKALAAAKGKKKKKK
jgi:tRNA nucleotidyltransferase/poly(A) polymerase